MGNGPADSRIPLTVIGGFLGSGKTTFLNHLLRQADCRYTVLVNDFGAINIDVGLIESHDGNTINLANGCVCCTMSGGLSETIAQIIDAPVRPEHIVIEASGVSDPWQIAEVALLEPDLDLAGVIVLADVERLPAQLADSYIGDTVRRQIMRCDLLLLNKTDLIDADRLQTVRSQLMQLRPDLRIIETQQAQLPRALLALTHDPQVEIALPVVAEHGIRRWLYRRRASFDRAGLEALLDRLPPSVLRLKGWCSMADAAQPILLQSTGSRWSLSPADSPAAVLLQNEILLVGLGTAEMPDDSAMAALFDTILHTDGQPKDAVA
jgi:G3E family GTPase